MPRTEQQNEAHRKQQRDKLLTAALHVFARRGMAATKISDIAREAKLSHGLFYHYFQSKEEIFTHLVQLAAEQLTEVIKELRLSKDRLMKKNKIDYKSNPAKFRERGSHAFLCHHDSSKYLRCRARRSNYFLEINRLSITCCTAHSPYCARSGSWRDR